MQTSSSRKIRELTGGLGIDLGVDFDVFKELDLEKLKCYLSLTNIDLNIKYSEYGILNTRYPGEESESEKEYLRIRVVKTI